jgi:FixJ family two-component response regulator
MNIDDDREHAARAVASLTDQEKRVLDGLVSGRSIASIAAFLSISTPEAAAAREVLMKKLGARTTADAVRIGIYVSVQWRE